MSTAEARPAKPRRVRVQFALRPVEVFVGDTDDGIRWTARCGIHIWDEATDSSAFERIETPPSLSPALALDALAAILEGRFDS